jgi:hypothetical protein
MIQGELDGVAVIELLLHLFVLLFLFLLIVFKSFHDGQSGI